MTMHSNESIYFQSDKYSRFSYNRTSRDRTFQLVLVLAYKSSFWGFISTLPDLVLVQTGVCVTVLGVWTGDSGRSAVTGVDSVF